MFRVSGVCCRSMVTAKSCRADSSVTADGYLSFTCLLVGSCWYLAGVSWAGYVGGTRLLLLCWVPWIGSMDRGTGSSWRSNSAHFIAYTCHSSPLYHVPHGTGPGYSRQHQAPHYSRDDAAFRVQQAGVEGSVRGQNRWQLSSR